MIVTSSLPYANGDIHIGHLVEYMQTDIWARFQKMRDVECYYICGTDAHGTPVMLRAQKEGIEPEQLIEKMQQSQLADFKAFGIDFDEFYTTHSPENRELTEKIYLHLKETGSTYTKTIEQAYDPKADMFLPDRFVKGACPKCGAEDQYGDACEACGATYSPLEMTDPCSVISGEKPVKKASEHVFFDLAKHEAFLKDWAASGALQPAISNKLKEWFESGLQGWDIARDKPYFGFEIPGEKDKYFYVWLDAPVGYIASFKHFADQKGMDFLPFWQENSTTELYHFVGKDVAYFHALFWPAVLKASEHRLPNGVFVHGFLTVNGKKMSKSRGTFIRASTYAKHCDPEALRYYFASKLSDSVEDIDFNVDDFRQKVNSDLVGKLVNIASRCAGFISKRFDGKLAPTLTHPLLDECQQAADKIATLFEARQFSSAIREIMRQADNANQFISDQQPWVLAKKAETLPEVQVICTIGLNLFRLLMIYLTPVLPALSEKVSAFLNVDAFVWEDCQRLLFDHQINPFKPLMTRLEEEQTQAMLDESQDDIKAADDATPTNPHIAAKPIKDEITIDDFAKIDLRIAKIVEANAVEGADKLIQLKLDVGGETRQIFAGIKKAYQPEDLVGRLTVVVANLKPRKMRFGLSEGMVALAASHDGGLYLLSPESGAEPGMPVQ
jgi:methionyl-tRNA synthetase